MIAGFRAFGPRVVAGAKPVLRPYQIARQAEAIDQKMRQENYRHCPCGADEQERKAVRDHMAQGRPRASAFVDRHPIALGDIIPKEVQKQLFHTSFRAGNFNGAGRTAVFSRAWIMAEQQHDRSVGPRG